MMDHIDVICSLPTDVRRKLVASRWSLGKALASRRKLQPGEHPGCVILDLFEGTKLYAGHRSPQMEFERTGYVDEEFEKVVGVKLLGIGYVSARHQELYVGADGFFYVDCVVTGYSWVAGFDVGEAIRNIVLMRRGVRLIRRDYSACGLPVQVYGDDVADDDPIYIDLGEIAARRPSGSMETRSS